MSSERRVILSAGRGVWFDEPFDDAIDCDCWLCDCEDDPFDPLCCEELLALAYELFELEFWLLFDELLAVAFDC